jgi:phage terminase large subunit-like protein
MTTATAPRHAGGALTPPDDDPVTAYAVAVQEGQILACRAVRQAAARHVSNLACQRTAAFPYYFDVRAARHIIDFFPEFLTLENGEPFVLPAWLQFAYGSIFGWKVWGGDADIAVPDEHHRRVGKRRFMHGFFETSKGSGKTPSAAGIGLYGLEWDDEHHAEIYSCAYDRGQASIVVNDAIRMAQASEDLSDLFEIGKYNIANLGNGSYFRAASKEHRGKSGPRPHIVLGDEIHEMRDGSVLHRLTAGFKFRTQPLALLFTNSGSDRQSICWEYHQKSLSVLDGTQPDEQWFAYVCHLDPCEACYRDGYRQPKDGCADCDDWTDPAVWPKVAPALGVVIQPKYLHDAVATALSVPSEYALKRRLNFCIWTDTHQVWIPPDHYAACQVPSVSADNHDYRPCAAGLDLSSKLDLSALVVALRIDDVPSSPAEQVTIEGRGEDGARLTTNLTLNFSVELIPFFWIPEQTLLERVRNERIPYDVWRRSGRLTATPGAVIDHQLIYDEILATRKRYHIQRLGLDERDATMMFVKLRDEAGLGESVLGVGQGKKLSEAFKLIEVLIRSKRLRHDGHPVLAWNFGNAEPHRDRMGALWIEKPSEIKRIDGAVAAAMALKELMVLPPGRSARFGMEFL